MTRAISTTSSRRRSKTMYLPTGKHANLRRRIPASPGPGKDFARGVRTLCGPWRQTSRRGGACRVQCNPRLLPSPLRPEAQRQLASWRAFGRIGAAGLLLGLALKPIKHDVGGRSFSAIELRHASVDLGNHLLPLTISPVRRGFIGKAALPASRRDLLRYLGRDPDRYGCSPSLRRRAPATKTAGARNQRLYHPDGNHGNSFPLPTFASPTPRLASLSAPLRPAFPARLLAARRRRGSQASGAIRPGRGGGRGELAR